MEIKLKEVTIREVVKGYIDKDETGVFGYGGKLNIRPIYQREYRYGDTKLEDAVINTIRKECPLNTMYWKKNDDNTYELLDGQQRTISFCKYIEGDFSLDYKYFQTLEKEEQEQILNYKLMIYICKGTDKEKLDWFKTINIAGMKLTDQELRNAIYTGPWLSNAKKQFSKTGCPAYLIANKYLKGSAIRQDYLETAIKWISEESIEQYMADNQKKSNANKLWLYFQNVINWVETIFPNYRKEMKGVQFGLLYNKFKDKEFNSKEIEKEIVKLMQDEDVTKKSGIYSYVLTKQEKFLSIRTFSDKIKREAYEKQKGICTNCKKHFKIEETEADHIKPWSDGGQTTSDNCQILCKQCNRIKSNN